MGGMGGGAGTGLGIGGVGIGGVAIVGPHHVSVAGSNDSSLIVSLVLVLMIPIKERIRTSNRLHPRM